MDIVNLIISLLSGGVGGNLAGAALKDNSLGAIGNTIVGLLGGVGGQHLAQTIGLISKAAEAGQLDLGSILANIGTSGVSGAAVLAIVSLIKSAISKA